MLSIPAEQVPVVFRPEGLLSRCEGEDFRIYANAEGFCMPIASSLQKKLISTDPSHPADAALIKSLAA
jgi:hypothetical protein